METYKKTDGEIRFGPAGNSADFYAAGFKRTSQAPAFLDGLGLNAFEYSFGRGVSIGAATAEEIRAAFSRFDIALSCHAPYYINLNSAEDAKIKASFGFIAQSVAALKSMGGTRCVFHPGSVGDDNAAATAKITANAELLLAYLDGLNLTDYTLCPETMGKSSQWGSADEIINICALDARLTPCFDFGHINSRSRGGLKTYGDYKRIIDLAADVLGDYKAKNFHVHFSKIQYGESGEIRHLTFDDGHDYGPDFEPLAKLIYEYKLAPTVICESRETQSRDAVTMKEIYEDKLRSV